MTPRVQHIHIPKCAGNSIFTAIRQALQPDRSLVLDSIATYLAARRLRPCRNEFEFEGHHLEVKQTLLAVYLEQGWPLISGHLPFSPLCQKQHGDQLHCLTLLREPLARLKSHVAYLIFAQPRTCVEDYQTGKVDPADEVHRILEREEIGIWMARSQCLYLGGLGLDGQADVAHCRANAIRALEALRLVGFDDDLEAFAEDFAAAYGHPLHIGRQNTIQSVQADPRLLQRVYAEMDGPLHARLLEMSSDDLALYEAARQRFPRRHR